MARDHSKRRGKNPTRKVRAKYADAGIVLPEASPLKGRLPAKGELIGVLERMYVVQYASELEIRMVPVPERMRAMAEEVIRKMDEAKAKPKTKKPKMVINDADTGQPIEEAEIEDRKEAGL